MIEAIKQVVDAMAIRKDWLGAGAIPVAMEQAERRANICRVCPLNVELGWWGRVKSLIADTIRLHMEVKNQMQLRVSCESELGMCRACGCAIPLKVHVPIEHIKEHTRPEMMRKFVPWCWIRKEIQ